MLSQIPERPLLMVRMVLLSSWLAVTVHLLARPLLNLKDTQIIAKMHDQFHDRCIQIQDHCVSIHPNDQIASFFWGCLIPGVILLLFIAGHVAWRRICPLAFASQIPRLLGWQRKNASKQPIRIDASRGIGKFALYFQWGFLYVGLCLRILLIDADSGWLGLWFLGTIGFAVAIGYAYAGKTWCHYFCPMAPVQKIFAEPVGLLTPKAHIHKQSITQSMCRSPHPSQGDRSACVACQSPCLDIDAERSYWTSLDQPATQWIYYSYLGLVLGFFGCFYLYAGNWDYYFSGVWSRESTLFADLWRQGLYFAPHQPYFSKIVVVPIVLAGSSLLSYGLGMSLERLLLRDRDESTTPDRLYRKHQWISLWAWLAFNVFFAFAGRPILQGLPIPSRTIANVGLTVLLLIISSLWLLRNLRHSPDRYQQEKRARQCATRQAFAQRWLAYRWTVLKHSLSAIAVGLMVPKRLIERPKLDPLPLSLYPLPLYSRDATHSPSPASSPTVTASPERLVSDDATAGLRSAMLGSN